MRSNELRIGNYVQHLNTELQVCQIFLDSFQGMFIGGKGVYTLEYSKGIPLTEEWLIKFGFEDHNGSFFKIPVGISELHINPDNGVVWIENNKSVFNNPALIDYVHQLMNLYFALTGTELTIKP
jgi:hypothetical protein